MRPTHSRLIAAVLMASIIRPRTMEHFTLKARTQTGLEHTLVRVGKQAFLPFVFLRIPDWAGGTAGEAHELGETVGAGLCRAFGPTLLQLIECLFLSRKRPLWTASLLKAKAHGGFSTFPVRWHCGIWPAWMLPLSP